MSTIQEKIKESIAKVEREKDILYDLLIEAGIDSEDEPCEAIETLISAVDELNQLKV